MSKEITITVEWHDGQPEKAGEYMAVSRYGTLYEILYTPEFGWNTTEDGHEHAIENDYFICWSDRMIGKIVAEEFKAESREAAV